MKPKIVVAGSSNTDMVVKVHHIPAPGETVMGSGFMVLPGGKGANQAVAAARAGADVSFIACVSDDAFGIQSLNNFRKDGINTSYVKVQPGMHSGVALINVADDGENSIAVAPGANSQLLPEDILKSDAAFKDAQLVLAQLEIPVETVEAVADAAWERKIPFILNPAPGIKIQESLLRKITVITPNESEAAIITSCRQPGDKSIPQMAGELLEMGVKIAMITLGSRGIFLKTNDDEALIPGYKVRAVDTTAAGDVFNGALAAALAGGSDIREAVDFAQRAAAISVTRIGAQPSAPYLEEIMNFDPETNQK